MKLDKSFMPHATMDRRQQTGVGPGGTPQNVYYTLQPTRNQAMFQDNYGSLPNNMNHNIQPPSYNDLIASQNNNSANMYPQSHYATLPAQHRSSNSPLPSYNSSHSGSPQLGGYNTMPAKGGNYGALPSHQEYNSQTLPAQLQEMPNRQLPPPSLTRHSVKILQVPFLVVGEGGGREVMARASPSPSPSPSSTISDPASETSQRPQSAPMQIMPLSSSPRVGHFPGHAGTPPMGGSGSFNQGFPVAPMNHQPGRFYPSTGSGQPQGFSTGNGHHAPQGFQQGNIPMQGFPHSGSQSHNMVHAATLPHRSSTIPAHVHRPSPSSSPASTSSLPATLPHPHHNQQHHQHHHHHHHQQPARPSPTPSPIPNNHRMQPPQMNIPPSPSPMTMAIQPHNHNSQAVAIPSPGSNNHNTFPQTGSMLSLSKPDENMDISGKMRSMQEEMHRMQKQMENQFRNLQVGGPPSMPSNTSSFPDFPAMMPPPFGSLPPPAIDLPGQTSSSMSNLSTPSLIEPDFGSMMTPDMGMGQPIVEDSLGAKGGKKQLKLNLDMHEFAPDEVKVRSDKNKLEVTAHHEEKDPNRITCRVFKQQYHLPENTRMAKLQYDMSPQGELKVEGTVKPRHRVKWAEDTLTKK